MVQHPEHRHRADTLVGERQLLGLGEDGRFGRSGQHGGRAVDTDPRPAVGKPAVQLTVAAADVDDRP